MTGPDIAQLLARIVADMIVHFAGAIAPADFRQNLEARLALTGALLVALQHYHEMTKVALVDYAGRDDRPILIQEE